MGKRKLRKKRKKKGRRRKSLKPKKNAKRKRKPNERRKQKKQAALKPKRIVWPMNEIARVVSKRVEVHDSLQLLVVNTPLHRNEVVVAVGLMIEVVVVVEVA